MNRPVATYRIQLTPGFAFDAVAAVAPYVARLGATHLYLSPVFEAREGSTHGYDVTDPTRMREELGGPAAFDRLLESVRAAGMRLLLDIVPNHMAASAENPWWRDLLEYGPASPFIDYFAIRRGDGGSFVRIALPILGDTLDAVLDSEPLDVLLDDGLWLGYHEHRVPLAPATFAAALGLDDPHAEPLPEPLAAALERARAAGDDAERRDAGASARDTLIEAVAEPKLRRRLRRRLAHRFGPDRDAHDRLRRLLDAQHYELTHWRSVDRNLPYRRFFDITQLVAVQVELDEVFEASHALIRRLLRDPAVHGLRVDHVDGLRDPRGYLDRLADLARGAAGAPDPRIIIVEKILAPDERLPDEWRVDGATGYEFMNVVGGWFIDPVGHARLREIWHDAVPAAPPFGELARRMKSHVIDRLFPGELRDLSDSLARIAPDGHHGRDAAACGVAIRALTAALDVYRTYIREDDVPERDRVRIERAVAAARDARGLDPDVLAFLHGVLILDPTAFVPDQRAAALRFVLDWQQFSAPVMAKGFEDTALYNDHALLAANEVGSDPEAPATSTPALHGFFAARTATPLTLNATSTHDTKRGEDVRARLAVLSQDADAWAELVDHWLAAAPRRAARRLSSRDELLLLQTLVGTWPLDGKVDREYAARIRAYMIKAAREAKMRTSWREPDADYEAALDARVASILAAVGSSSLELVRSFAARVAFVGALESLVLICLKSTAPGVPDFYQGTEDWHYTLVDPDNRRSVDFAGLTTRRAELDPAVCGPSPARVAPLLRDWRDGRIKAFLTSTLLRWRARTANTFDAAGYVPIEVIGDRASHLVAFARRAGESWVVVIASRWLLGAAMDGSMPDSAFWGATFLALPEGAPRAWTDALSGAWLEARNRTIRMSDALRTLPCALLVEAVGATRPGRRAFA